MPEECSKTQPSLAQTEKMKEWDVPTMRKCVEDWDAHWKGGGTLDLTAFWRREKYADLGIPCKTFWAYARRDEWKMLPLGGRRKRRCKRPERGHLSEEERALKRRYNNTRGIYRVRYELDSLGAGARKNC